MKNKTFLLTLLILSSLVFTSCAGNRTGYTNPTHRKGYGCPASASISNPSVEKNKV
jgi:hypothetical protein